MQAAEINNMTLNDKQQFRHFSTNTPFFLINVKEFYAGNYYI